MKRLAFAVALILGAASGAHADFTTGLRAYEAGDYYAAYKEWLPLAEADDPAAQRNLGHLYRLGRGVTKDFVKAAEWYRKSAEQGFSRAQANLGNMYLREQGVPKDPVTAAKWFGRAAKQNHPIAQYNLGLMYENGIGVAKDDVAALGWYFRASKAGHRKAAQRLARLVSRGATPPTDDSLPPTETDKKQRLASAQRGKPAQPLHGGTESETIDAKDAETETTASSTAEPDSPKQPAVSAPHPVIVAEAREDAARTTAKQSEDVPQGQVATEETGDDDQGTTRAAEKAMAADEATDEEPASDSVPPHPVIVAEAAAVTKESEIGTPPNKTDDKAAADESAASEETAADVVPPPTFLTREAEQHSESKTQLAAIKPGKAEEPAPARSEDTGDATAVPAPVQETQANVAASDTALQDEKGTVSATESRDAAVEKPADEPESKVAAAEVADAASISGSTAELPPVAATSEQIVALAAAPEAGANGKSDVGQKAVELAALRRAARRASRFERHLQSQLPEWASEFSDVPAPESDDASVEATSAERPQPEAVTETQTAAMPAAETPTVSSSTAEADNAVGITDQRTQEPISSPDGQTVAQSTDAQEAVKELPSPKDRVAPESDKTGVETISAEPSRPEAATETQMAAIPTAETTTDANRAAEFESAQDTEDLGSLEPAISADGQTAPHSDDAQESEQELAAPKDRVAPEVVSSATPEQADTADPPAPDTASPKRPVVGDEPHSQTASVADTAPEPAENDEPTPATDDASAPPTVTLSAALASAVADLGADESEQKDGAPTVAEDVTADDRIVESEPQQFTATRASAVAPLETPDTSVADEQTSTEESPAETASQPAETQAIARLEANAADVDARPEPSSDETKEEAPAKSADAATDESRVADSTAAHGRSVPSSLRTESETAARGSAPDAGSDSPPNIMVAEPPEVPQRVALLDHDQTGTSIDPDQEKEKPSSEAALVAAVDSSEQEPVQAFAAETQTEPETEPSAALKVTSISEVTSTQPTDDILEEERVRERERIAQQRQQAREDQATRRIRKLLKIQAAWDVAALRRDRSSVSEQVQEGTTPPARLPVVKPNAQAALAPQTPGPLPDDPASAAPVASTPDRNPSADLSAPKPDEPEPEIPLIPAPLGVALDAGLAAYQAHDYESAFEHWMPRAESGDTNAQFFVGGLYRDGAGVPVDPVRAYHWWTLAAAQGHLQADRLLVDLKSEMLPHEIAEARKLSE